LLFSLVLFLKTGMKSSGEVVKKQPRFSAFTRSKPLVVVMLQSQGKRKDSQNCNS
jgi:hypothetical protein